jgi:cytochrome c-type biogenesis protein CcmH
MVSALRRVVWTLAMIAAVAFASPALAAAPQTSLADVEDEVMCPICGTLLELSESPQAERQKAFIGTLIAQGKTKAEIKDALVDEYGQEVLALPEGSGFNLSAYLAPVIAFVVAAVALALGVARWRRESASRGLESAATAPSGEEAERLDADLSKYDL